MKNRTTQLTAVALLLALGPMAVNAVPVQCTNDLNNKHYYEVIVAGDIAWSIADAAASAMFFEPPDEGSIQGHLATSTSELENDCINDLRVDTDVLGQFWIGGFQAADATAIGQGWQWVNGEGGISTFSVPIPFAYSNWLGGEPNDGNNSENHQEDQLTIGIGDSDVWNDSFSGVNAISGYVVEFDGTVDASTCLPPNTCNPSGVIQVDLGGIEVPTTGITTITQNLLKPDPLVPADDICTGQFTYRDPRADDDGSASSIRSLDVFGELGGGDPGTLILDEFNYGSPCFAIVKGSASFDFAAGVVQSEELPDEVPGIGPVFTCTDADLQRRVDFGYQTDDLNDMIENSEAAMTSSCNSPSRGATFRFSFFVLNTHEDCGIPFGTNAPAVLQCFKDFARNKFDATHQSLKNSKKSLIDPKFGKLQSKLSNAKDKFLNGDFDGSLADLAELLSRVNAAMFSGLSNHQGNLIMRIENLQHRVDEIKVAEAALVP